nr:uncharacterized protein At4g10930 isoform X2 [Ipomoea batatas]
MEVELVTDGMPEDEKYGIDENFEDLSTFESERCGICMDIVIDRGVLDCCQHWFCFTCIDNWATITNLCPLCQIEFQLITCVPVFDTIGGNKTDDDSFRDDDWSIEGKNNTLSFPSYYIDENAVVCLDGDGCKIRAGSAGIEADSNLDTSIACDSCDTWYHAFCVGFDPEGTCENSWLCPRCIADNIPGKLDVLPVSKSSNQCDPEKANGQISTSNCSKDIKPSTLSSNSVVDIHNSVLDDSKCILPNLEPEDQELPSSLHKSSDSTPYSSTLANVEINTNDKVTSGMALLQRSVQPLNNKVIEPGLDLHLGLAVGSCTKGFSADNSDDRLMTEKEVPVAIAGAKRKHREIRDAEKGRSKGKSESPHHLKKAKTEGNGQTDPKDQTVTSTSDDQSKSCVTVPKDGKLKCISKKESADIDIMDIVQGTSRKPLKKSARSDSDGMSSKQMENAAGLRVKKIMRRVDGEDSSVLVQKLRKDIREAVRSKSTEELDKNIFDPKLLAAFRTVVAGSTTETMKSHLDLKAKQSLLQKGKIRENLTKKIYGIGGRRKRAWTRDCEIEFWKHRCSKASKPEKIQTLKSVLNLLRDDSGNAEIKHTNAGEGSGSILSRLYLADTSVFPRKDNIKPVSSLNTSGMSEQITENGPPANASKPSLPSHADTVPQNNEALKQVPIPPLTAKVAPKMVPNKKPDSSSRLHSNKCLEGPSNSTSSSTIPSKGESVLPSDNTKTDRKKWALELLARKASAVTKNAADGNAEDNAALKQTYPLLAQLPKDMRPVLAASRHNKVPMSIRQAQLYRLTEHFLRKANLAVIHRTADTELAVADAINIEKEVADKSNSKLVYVNLCSQELRRRSDSTSSDKATGLNPGQSTEMPSNALEASIENHSADSAVVNEALINAGLLSDSPPSTPQRPTEEFKEENCFSNEVEDDGPNDVFEVEPPPELDIYGDFDYNLEDDFTGASSSMISEPQLVEAKMKVIFSTHNPDTSNVTLEQPNVERRETFEGPKDSSCLVDSDLASTEAGSSLIDTSRDNSIPQSSFTDGGEELSIAECEELYGPDKEPLIQKYPEMASLKPCELAINNQISQTNGGCESSQAAKSSELDSESGMDNVEASASSQCPSITENSPNKLEGSENVQRRDNASKSNTSKESDSTSPVSRKVEAYIKEHIRPLCKSGVISVEQYRWAVSKTTEKVMKYHSKDKNANFLIKEGEKVKKLAEQYVEAAQNMPKNQ